MLEGTTDHDEALAATLAIRSYATVSLATTILGFVMQLVLCLYSLWIVKQEPPRRKRTCLLLVAFTIWILYSATAGIEVWRNLDWMLKGGVPEFPLWTYGAGMGLTMTYILIGDCLMLWRCYGIWNRKKVVVLFPTLLLVTSISFGILSTINSITDTLPALVGLAWVAFSVATNVTVTSLIVYKLVIVRREIIRSKLYDKVWPLYWDVIIILVESAAPLALAGLCSVAVSAARLSGDIAPSRENAVFLLSLVSHLLFLLFGALSPQMILFRTLVCAPNGLVQAAEKNAYKAIRASKKENWFS
ncbi:hypothetical protein BKA70DRAFT_1445880 [Coprinopsis sp. MPI-PUGE-AT-0042]|nr:hypothetical protein BKA70DRAFT_1445880 [Coprinopsis sp. MPI-PUGE-AT-0042]